jgi:hypothetical protein
MESEPGAVATGSSSRFQDLWHSNPVATVPGSDLNYTKKASVREASCGFVDRAWTIESKKPQTDPLLSPAKLSGHFLFRRTKAMMR